MEIKLINILLLIAITVFIGLKNSSLSLQIVKKRYFRKSHFSLILSVGFILFATFIMFFRELLNHLSVFNVVLVIVLQILLLSEFLKKFEK